MAKLNDWGHCNLAHERSCITVRSRHRHAIGGMGDNAVDQHNGLRTAVATLILSLSNLLVRKRNSRKSISYLLCERTWRSDVVPIYLRARIGDKCCTIKLRPKNTEDAVVQVFKKT